jgi:hypothetical protein
MGNLGMILEAVAGLGSLVCFVLILVQIFQRGHTGLGIACIVLVFCVGIGGLIAFIYGWIKSREWNVTNIMIIWSICWVIGIAGYGLNPPQFPVLGK